MTDISKGTAIVTGASRGIGAAVAERLAMEGFAVVINYAGDKAPADALAAKIEKAAGHAISYRADVSNAAAMRAMFDAAIQRFGGVDVDADDAFFDTHIAINLKGVFNGLREAAKRSHAGGLRPRSLSRALLPAAPTTLPIPDVRWIQHASPNMKQVRPRG